ncbi:MAG: hypothetical protein JO117_06495 [Verrucomicrobia bacterium]|nr:hypothetical protein [Verrucomicrobiota bacterium]MBV9659118.1 hypothetical protein [Verrucomicrobiota bacterium]
MLRFRALFPLLVTAALGGWLLASGDARAQQQQPSTLPGSTNAGVNSPATATAGRTRRSLVNPADQPALAAFRLTPERLDQFEATIRRTVEALRKNPALREQARAAQAGGNGGRSIEATAAQLEKDYPEYAALIREAGWSVREYLLTTFSLFVGTMFSGVQGNPPPYVSPENLAFVRANLPRIQADFRRLETETRGSAGDERH